MISVEEAQRRIVAAFQPLPAETVSLAEALGRVLAEDAHARVTQPPKAVSAMDGYAVRAGDIETVPATLRQVAEIAAGQSFDGTIGTGQAARIFTGAPLPDGADTIVIQENTTTDGDRITVSETAARGAYVRREGLDFRAGDLGLPAGRTLGPRDIGLAAAMNLPWLPVRRRPRIALLATGDEIVLPGEPLRDGQIVSSNSWALAAFVSARGGVPVNLGIAPDRADSLRRMAAAAAGADLLVTSGGASVGKHDLVQSALGEMGLEIDFWKIAMRPGKPLMFGAIHGPGLAVPLLGLPGNPVSAMVCALLFLGTVLDRLLGRKTVTRVEQAVLGAPLPANDMRQDYLRARLERSSKGPAVATAFDRQDSSMMSLLADADCLIVRAPHVGPLPAGAPVEILPLLRFAALA